MLARTNLRHLIAWAVAALIPAAALAEPMVLYPPGSPNAASTTASNPLTDPRIFNGKILVVPFEAVNPAEPNAWLGKSIQQTLVSDLIAIAPGRVISVDQPASTVEAALALGRQHDARYVIAGGFVTSDRSLRATGQILDTLSGQAITGLKATGDTGQIFRMEDTLSNQVKEQLFPNARSAATADLPSQPMVAAPTAPSYYSTGVRTDDGLYSAPGTTPYYSSYATAPTPLVYGSDYPAAPYYPGYTYYDAYPDYGYSPYLGYGLGLGCFYPCGFGFGLGFGFGGYGGYGGYGRGYGYHHYGHYGYGYSHYGSGYRGSAFNASLGVSRGVGFSGGITVNAARASSAAVRSYAPYRAQAFYSHPSYSRAASGSAFHAMSSFRSFGGGAHFGGGGHGGGHR